MAHRKSVCELLSRHEGLLKLRPAFVRRFYPDLNRLGQNRFRSGRIGCIPERWIGSSIEAANPPPLPRGGLSMLNDSLSLRDAIRTAPGEMLGETVVRAHGPEFRLLVKILDPGEPIVFHFHATDGQVRRRKKNFRGHRFGKDEAYYFLDDVPKGPVPYTHVGLHEGVTRRDLIRTITEAPERVLELSPSLYQECGTGFFVPAGVPHRPGTALTLEIQQPSDVYTLLETHAGGNELSPGQIHPGFRSLDEAVALIDVGLARKVGRMSGYRLNPRARTVGGGEIAGIFPADICRKFAGDRLRIESSLSYSQHSPLVLLAWRGRGRINGRSARAGDEFFVTYDTARRGIEIENSSGEARLEIFSFRPVI